MQRSRRTALARALLLSVTIAAGAACRSATAPGAEAGTYVLRSVAETSAMFEGMPIVVADTIVLDGAGRAERRQVLGSTARAHGFAAALDQQPYRLAGVRITLGNLDPCGPAANCLPTEFGTVAGGVLTLTGPLGYTERLERIAR